MALPQKHRLRGTKVFDRLYRQGRRFHGTWLTLRVLPAVPHLLSPRDRPHPASPWRCAVVVSSKVSKRAVRRNHLRRLLQQQLLHEPPVPSCPAWLVFSLKPGSLETDEALLLGECRQLLRKAELRK
ncbi:MAG: ribonuclease P protein component [Cyanobacteriota bacterium]|nr:ribonuclease P protein component [Cyanobacteriota bacterium]